MVQRKMRNRRFFIAMVVVMGWATPGSAQELSGEAIERCERENLSMEECQRRYGEGARREQERRRQEERRRSEERRKEEARPTAVTAGAPASWVEPQNGGVYYIRSQYGAPNHPKRNFYLSWSGAATLVHPTEKIPWRLTRVGADTWHIQSAWTRGADRRQYGAHLSWSGASGKVDINDPVPWFIERAGSGTYYIRSRWTSGNDRRNYNAFLSWRDAGGWIKIDANDKVPWSFERVPSSPFSSPPTALRPAVGAGAPAPAGPAAGARPTGAAPMRVAVGTAAVPKAPVPPAPNARRVMAPWRPPLGTPGSSVRRLGIEDLATISIDPRIAAAPHVLDMRFVRFTGDAAVCPDVDSYLHDRRRNLGKHDLGKLKPLAFVPKAKSDRALEDLPADAVCKYRRLIGGYIDYTDYMFRRVFNSVDDREKPLLGPSYEKKLLFDYGCRQIFRTMPEYAKVVRVEEPGGVDLVGDWTAPIPDAALKADGLKETPKTSTQQAGPGEPKPREPVEICIVTNPQLEETLLKDLGLISDFFRGRAQLDSKCNAYACNELPAPLSKSVTPGSYNFGKAFQNWRLGDGQPIGAIRTVDAISVCSLFGGKKPAVAPSRGDAAGHYCVKPGGAWKEGLPTCRLPPGTILPEREDPWRSSTKTGTLDMRAARLAAPPIPTGRQRAPGGPIVLDQPSPPPPPELACRPDWDFECKNRNPKVREELVANGPAAGGAKATCRVSTRAIEDIILSLEMSSDLGRIDQRLKGETLGVVLGRYESFLRKMAYVRALERSKSKASRGPALLPTSRVGDETEKQQELKKEAGIQNNDAVQRIVRDIVRQKTEQWTHAWEYSQLSGFLNSWQNGRALLLSYLPAEAASLEKLLNDPKEIRGLCEQPRSDWERKICLDVAIRVLNSFCLGSGEPGRCGVVSAHSIHEKNSISTEEFQGNIPFTFTNWLAVRLASEAFATHYFRPTISRGHARTDGVFMHQVSSSVVLREFMGPGVEDFPGTGRKYFMKLPLTDWQRCRVLIPPSDASGCEGLQSDYWKHVMQPRETIRDAQRAAFGRGEKESWHQSNLFSEAYRSKFLDERFRELRKQWAVRSKGGSQGSSFAELTKWLGERIATIDGKGKATGQDGSETGGDAGDAIMDVADGFLGKLVDFLLKLANMGEIMKTVASAAGLTPEQAADCEDAEYRKNTMGLAGKYDNKRDCLLKIFATNFGSSLESIVVMLGGKVVDWLVDMIRSLLSGVKGAITTALGSVPFAGGFLAAGFDALWEFIMNFGAKELLKATIVNQLPKWLQIRELAKLDWEQLKENVLVRLVLGTILRLISSALRYGKESWTSIGAGTVFEGIKKVLEALVKAKDPVGYFFIRVLTFAKRELTKEVKGEADFLGVARAFVSGITAVVARGINDADLQERFVRAANGFKEKLNLAAITALLQGMAANPMGTLGELLGKHLGPIAVVLIATFVPMANEVRNAIVRISFALFEAVAQGVTGGINIPAELGKAAFELVRHFLGEAALPAPWGQVAQSVVGAVEGALFPRKNQGGRGAPPLSTVLKQVLNAVIAGGASSIGLTGTIAQLTTSLATGLVGPAVECLNSQKQQCSFSVHTPVVAALLNHAKAVAAAVAAAGPSDALSAIFDAIASHTGLFADGGIFATQNFNRDAARDAIKGALPPSQGRENLDHASAAELLRETLIAWRPRFLAEFSGDWKGLQTAVGRLYDEIAYARVTYLETGALPPNHDKEMNGIIQDELLWGVLEALASKIPGAAGRALANGMARAVRTLFDATRVDPATVIKAIAELVSNGVAPAVRNAIDSMSIDRSLKTLFGALSGLLTTDNLKDMLNGKSLGSLNWKGVAKTLLPVLADLAKQAVGGQFGVFVGTAVKEIGGKL